MARLLVVLASLQLAFAELQGEVDVATSGLYLVDVPILKDEPEGGRLKRSLRRGAQVVPGVGIMALGAYLWHKGGPHPLDSPVIVQELPVHHVLTEPKPTESPYPRWPFGLAALAFAAAMPILRLRRRAGKEAKTGRIVPLSSKVGSGIPGDPRAYDDIVMKREGSWALNGSSGEYRFDPSSGWLQDAGGEKLGRFICKQIQDEVMELPVTSYSKITTNLKIVSSEIMTEIQKPENAGALFVLPSQLNGAEYPSHMHVVKTVEEYKSDNTGGPRGQLAVHPAVAQFVLDNAASTLSDGGINAIDDILNQLGELEFVNGYLKVHDVDSHCEVAILEQLVKSLNTLRPLVMEDVPASGLTPDKKGFADNSHKVGLVYASAVPVDSYLNQGGKADFQAKISDLILIGQYYGALKYAAEGQRSKGSTAKRKVFLMPLGGGVFNNPWDIIAKSMAKAIQLLDNDLLALLDISALAWSGNPSEEQKLRIILGKLNSQAPVPSITLQPPGGKTQLFRIATGQPDEEPEPFMKRMMTDMSDTSDRPLVLEDQTEMFRMQTGDSERLPSPRMQSPRQVMRSVEEAPGEEEAEKEAEDAVEKKADEAKKAEEAQKAEEAKKAAKAAEAEKKGDEAKRAEEAKNAAEAEKKAEEAKNAESAKKAVEAAEAKKKADEAKKAEEAKKAAEAAEAERKAEEAKKGEEAKKAIAAAEAKKKADEAKRAEEAKKAAEAVEAKRKADEAKKAEETKKAARKAFEAAKKADEAKASEAARKAEEAQKAEEAKKAEAAEAKKKAEVEAQKAEEAKRAAEAKKAGEAGKKKAKGRKESKESAFLGSVEEANVSPRFEKGHGLKPVNDSELTPRSRRVSAKTPEQLPAQDTPRRGLNSSLVGNPGETIRQLAHALEFNQPPTYSPSSSRAGSPKKGPPSPAKDSKAAASK